MKVQQSRARYIITALFIAGFFLMVSCNFSFGGEESGSQDKETGKWDTARPLLEIYADKFLVGNIISPGDINDATRFGILKRHYNTLTAENDMKPNAIAPGSKPASDVWNYSFSQADRLVTAASGANMKMHGHTLVWHQQTPSWLTAGSKTEVLGNLEKYVTDVTTHFRGKLISWDVVNEAMRDGLTAADAAGDWKNCLRGGNDNRWNDVVGPEYIEKAFLAARAADPEVKLFYNDYSLNSFQGNYKQRAVYNMVQDINNRYSNVRGRPLIDGIGMQSHHHLNTVPESVKTSIDLFSSLGVEIAISEMDIMAAKTSYSGLTNSWDENAARLQAQIYAAMFRIFKDNASKISRVTFWGIDDGTS